MSESVAQASPPARQVRLACRLRRRQLARGISPSAGELELENTSASVVIIKVQTSPLQHLDLFVTGPDGKLVSDFCYGDLFSPLAEPYELQLQPGQKFVAPVSMLGNVPEKKRVPGSYKVQAVYTLDEMQSHSEIVEVRLD